MFCEYVPVLSQHNPCISSFTDTPDALMYPRSKSSIVPVSLTLNLLKHLPHSGFSSGLNQWKEHSLPHRVICKVPPNFHGLPDLCERIPGCRCTSSGLPVTPVFSKFHVRTNDSKFSELNS
ncbi:hypothetical protein Baya_7322 [Bagarius yarrelli]|uniref:Uncharacterized protein n=1 Tax=Bagarius yarrelli TaxID=175774 RepID=A0A556U1P3_BAGYA|nr:hypothetical protein Baya_7322 [Bagarius yarrelli]